MEKPPLFPKSLAVLLAAEEVRLMKQGRLKRAHSTSEIYDDIVSLKKDEVYDDILSIFPKKLSDTDANSNTLCLSSSSEDLYDDIVAKKPQKISGHSKPKPPLKPDSLSRHPKVMELLHKPSINNSWEFEEVYDTAQLYSYSTSNNDSNAEEVYVDPNFIETSDGESEHEYVISSLATAASASSKVVDEGVQSGQLHTPPPTQNTPDPHQDVEQSQQHPSGTSSTERDAYEDLVLYEDVEKYQTHCDGYEDPTTVVVKALELPQTIRQRTIRLVHGPQRSQLRKSIKKRSRERQCSVDTGCLEHVPSQCDDTGSDSEPVSQVPFGRAKIMFDMLLDASDIARIADRKPDADKPELPIVEVTTSGESGEELQDHKDYFDSKELLNLQQRSDLQHYKDAGVLQFRSTSEIVADIAQLTANAPKEPPPLPGITRPRALVATKPDRILQKRMRMKKANTIQ